MSDITLQSRLRPSLDAVTRELDGELVVLQLDSEIYFRLDEIGARMWEVVVEVATLAEAVERLAAEFEVEREVLKADVIELAQTLVGKGLLEVDG
jgi:hypothetical protein